MTDNTRARTPLLALKAMVKEVQGITQDMRFCDPAGKRPVPLSVYEQALPIPKRKAPPPEEDVFQTIDYQEEIEEDAVFKCPWCVVKLENGSIPGINEMQEVTFAVCFGIFNESLDNNGHMEIMNLIQRVYERFSVNPFLDGQYTCTGKFEWAVQDEDTYPYYFGAILTGFKFQGFRRENKYL
ncbi:hypothetical protein H8S75_31345 [Hungatella sp. L12]|uniref:Uncharacterized protein n=1 Tax=Hungatella hominis TaxID=2763050 RepID=A0ABR7HGU0_9FIRM|nr:hypothetical protein [Hungatella hominis]MBC5712398.1 hypothetical protein [Hungatella hominis]